MILQNLYLYGSMDYIINTQSDEYNLPNLIGITLGYDNMTQHSLEKCFEMDVCYFRIGTFYHTHMD